MWWETYQITHPIDGLDWDTFREGFRNAHISSGIMNVKKDEFRSLKQGGRTLKEYMDDFCALSRYAPDDIDTDAKRKEKFLNGLKGELKIPLSVAYAPNYQSLLDQAITLDNNIMKEENRKRKFNNGKTHIGSSHKRHHFSEGNGNGSNSNGHRHNGGNKGNHSNGGNGHQNGGNGHHNGDNGHQNEEMEITMEIIVSTTTTQKLRRISLISHASIARRKDIIPQTAQNLPSPIHSRRDM
jgi:hypothetical protein